MQRLARFTSSSATSRLHTTWDMIHSYRPTDVLGTPLSALMFFISLCDTRAAAEAGEPHVLANLSEISAMSTRLRARRQEPGAWFTA
jgi:hypothetical protein